ncbi:hypothetical protein ABZP36_005153 [Zizania latifolia]
MLKRPKLEGFSIPRPTSYSFERSQPAQRLYAPTDDPDLDDIAFSDDPEALSDVASTTGAGGGEAGNEEIDPLDAFMAKMQEEIRAPPSAPKPEALRRIDSDDEDDPRDDGLALATDAMHAGYDSDEEVYAAGMMEYDSDNNPIVVDKKKIEPIPPLDHSTVEYESFNKDFYEEQPSVSSFDVPRPIKNFVDCGFHVPLMNAIAKQGYEKPTTIQCQALPIVLSVRDVIGIAKTGSGKTAAFVLPMIVHIMDQPELEKEEGPIGVVCAPTRKLAHQIYLEAKKFAKPYNLRFKELKAGCEIVIATPGRLIDLLKMKALKMFRATYLVLDEADRMFDLGFEPQIRSIVGQIRPDRQTLLFSATMPYKVECLARETLNDPIRVTVGQVGSANEDIKQVVNVFPSDAEKMPWLLEKLPGMIDDGDVLVFAAKKARVDEIESQLNQRGFRIAALHGDNDQASRMETLQKFKSGVYHVLVATDVAARGLDIKSIKTVVNFDIAKEMDMHIHRIGRTGRAGDKDGTAYTLITQEEVRFAGELVHSLIAAGQNVPNELMDLAMKDGRFRANWDSRKGGKKSGKGKGGSVGSGGGRGSGARDRGRGVRGVDFGLGIGYNAEPGSQVPAPRSAAVNSLKTGMIQNFKNSFVSATSSISSNVAPSRGAPFVRPALRGFISGGTIGGVANPTQPVQTAASFVPASRPAENTAENVNPNPER